MTRPLPLLLAWLPALLMGWCGGPLSPAGDVLTLEVAAHTVPCVGEAPRRCLLVRRGASDEWTYFYDTIEGFAYQEGFVYRIRVSRQPVPDPPADASSFRYRLLELVSREPAPPG